VFLFISILLRRALVRLEIVIVVVVAAAVVSTIAAVVASAVAAVSGWPQQSARVQHV
jgi:hypothetical protein